MDTQEISDDILFRVITESSDVSWNFYALKVIISRLKLKLHLTNDEEAVRESCGEIRALLNKSINIPNAKKDVKIILERFG